jgi:hypothetical protein
MVVEVPPEKVKSTVATDYNNLVENILGLARAALVVVKFKIVSKLCIEGQYTSGIMPTCNKLSYKNNNGWQGQIKGISRKHSCTNINVN